MPVGDARNRLLMAARKRFAVDGALTATMDEIRNEAGVSVGALYHHFPDKISLATAVYAQVLAEYQADFVASLRRHDTAEGGIRGGVIHHLRWVSAHRAEATFLLGTRLDSADLRSSNAAFFAAVRDWWSPHHVYGVLHAMQPGVTAALWIGPAQEYSRYWLMTAEARMRRAAVDTLAAAAWNTLRQRG